MNRPAGLRLLLALGLCLVCAAEGRAQDDEAPRKAAFYRHVEAGQATMRVNVWGDVMAPGQYEVQAGTDLLEVLFLAGGPNEGNERASERRQTQVLVSRQTGDVWSTIFEAPLDDLTSFQQPYPPLQDGDALRLDVRVSRPFSWRDAFTIIGAVGTIALVIDRVVRIAE